MTQSRSQSQSAPDYFDDRLMTERETIISSRATMNQTFSLLEPGVTVIGLIVIPGAYKLSLIAAWVDQTTGMPVLPERYGGIIVALRDGRVESDRVRPAEPKDTEAVA